MFGDVLGETVRLVDTNPLHSIGVPEDIVVRGEDVIRSHDLDVEMQRTTVQPKLNSRGVDGVTVNQPAVYGFDGLRRGTEDLDDLFTSPVLAVVGRGGVRNIQEINFEVVEGNLQRNRGVELRTATEGSTRWNI